MSDLGNRPPEYEARVRLWHAAPDRYRAERAIVRGPNSEPHTRVLDGVDEWYYAPSSGVYKNPSNGRYVECGVLLDPAALLGSMRFGQITPGERAGRASVFAHGTLSDSERAPESVQELGLGADRYELHADAEHGVLLEFGAVFEDADMFRLRVEEVAFNEALPDGLFRLDAPPDVSVVDTDEIEPPESMPLEAAAERATFTLLVPRRAPAGTQLAVSRQSAQTVPQIHERVYLHYMFPNGAHSLLIAQTSVAGTTTEAAEDWTTEERDGLKIRHTDRGAQRDLELERDGTRVRISSTLELATLVELALSLDPAPTEPPRLVDA